jgi:hypothetical protein
MPFLRNSNTCMIFFALNIKSLSGQKTVRINSVTLRPVRISIQTMLIAKLKNMSFLWNSNIYTSFFTKNIKSLTGPKTFLVAAVFFLSILTSFSQQKNLPLNREFNVLKGNTEGFISSSKSHIDTSTITACGYSIWRTPPVKYNFFSSCFKPHIAPPTTNNNTLNHSLFRRKLAEENLFIVSDSTSKFHLSIDPLFNFEYGKDLANSSKLFYKNTRGILVRGDIGSKFFFESSFYENQATFVEYIQKFNDTYLVVPGQGRWKKFKNNGYDFAMVSGYISYSPNHHFNFQIGTGKHFVGDGYRSLLLSDNAFNYPFARITSSFGKFQYTNLYASFMNLTDGGVKTPPGTERLFQKKAANFQLLSWNVHKRIQLAFFQGLVWQANDSMNRQHLNFNYFSPIIYNAAISEGLKGRNNVLIGTTIKLKITNSISLYGQYMMDEFSSTKNSLHNKTGFQVGAKYFDVFKIKNLHLQMEYNQVRPYSYAHATPSQSYTQYNQPLAHPLGANFKESIIFLNYRIGDFFTEVKMNYTIIGKDSIGRGYGNTVFRSDNNSIYGPNSTNNKMGQGLKTILKIFDVHIGYLINPSTNLNIVLGISNRSFINKIENSQTNFVYVGFRTSLNNVYYDF